jgi:UDP-N-acetylmuramoyl-L-alanyl-D-glutamate--2,6-diaminopimelate ligase
VKTLHSLARALDGAQIRGDANPVITGFAYDSRRAQPGVLFACLPGLRTDGHLFINQALDNGAVALLIRSGYPSPPACPAIEVADTRVAFAHLASFFYDNPSMRLQLSGVTGTNGKTTTTYLLEAILRRCGAKTGVVGTLAYRIGQEEKPAPYTTPEASDLQALLAEMVSAGVSHAVMEVSSHALALRRADGCRMRCAILTNLTRDHLDFHNSMEDYRRAKARLFTEPCFLPRSGERADILNLDDPFGAELARSALGKVITYSASGAAGADFSATDVRITPEGTHYTINSPAGKHRVRLELLGQFNVQNALAATAAATELGADLAVALEALEGVSPVRGRFETVDQGQPFTVLIDYAHTPDGLEQALANARALAGGRVIVVFGCGGDRDRGKRPLMGRLASEMADLCVVTSDNPRSEDPRAIMEEIAAGVADRARCKFIEDRREAIGFALNEAKNGDLVLIAGKGHETYQIFRDATVPFDDREVAREILSQIHAGRG